MSDTDLKEKENLSTNPNDFEKEFGDRFTDEEKDKLNDLSDRVGKGYTSSGSSKKGGFFGRLSKRQKLAGLSGVGLVVSGAFALLSILQGPFQFVHFGQVVSKHFNQITDITDDQQLARVRYRRRLGTVGNKAADIVEAKLNKAGFTSAYNSAGSFIGFELDTSKVNVDELRGLGANIDESTPGKPVLVEDGSNFKRRRLVKGVLQNAGMTGIPGRISSRLLRTRGNISFKVLGNLDRKQYETSKAFQDAVLKKFTEYFKNGVSLRVRSSADDTTQNDENISDEEKNRNRADSDGFQGSLDDVAANPTDGNIDKVAGEIDAGKTGAKSADALGFFCAVRAVGNAYQATVYAKTVLPLIRIGVSFASISSQVMSNKATIDELGAFNKMMYDEKDGTSWAAARSIQYELGQDQTGPDMPAAAKPGRAGKKPAFFETVDKAFSIPGTTTACKVNDSTAGGLAISLFTGGFATEAFFTALSAAGIDPMGKLIEGAIGLAVGSPLKDLPKGALLGNYVNYGALLAATDQIIALGGGVLSVADAVVLKEEQLRVEQETYANLPLKDKIFNLYEPRSLASQAVFKSPSGLSTGNMATTFGSLIRSPTNIFGSIGVKRVSAQTSYDYGVDAFGFSKTDQDDPKFADPYAVEDYMHSGTRLQDMNEKYGKCFSTTINPETKTIQSGKIVNYYEDSYKNDCMKNSSDSDYIDYTYFRFYLLGKVTERSVECYGGYEDSCDQVGYGTGGTNSGTQAAGQPNNTTSGAVGDIGQSSDSIDCAEGTKNLGVAESKYTGPEKKEPGPIKVRLCQVPVIAGYGENTKGERIGGGAVVNSRVSASWHALGTQASQAGVPLRADSSFRLKDSCGGTGNGTACATPGKSYHQLGVAIDIDGIDHSKKGGSTANCSSRAKDTASKEWNWLYKNAEAFGFRQYSYEPWHWDPADRPNRCGGGA